MTPLPATLEHALSLVSLRIAVSRAGPSVLGTLTVTALAMSAAAPLLRWLGALEPWWLVSIPILAALAALAARARRPSPLAAAVAIDCSHGLHDAIATALSASRMPGADPAFVELQRRTAFDAAVKVDPRRVDAPPPRRTLVAASALAMALLAAAIIAPWPEPRGSHGEARSGREVATIPEPAPETPELRSLREIASLSERIEQLAERGDLDAMERAIEEMDLLSRALAERRNAGADPATDPSTHAKEQRSLVESASRMGEAAESLAKGAGERADRLESTARSSADSESHPPRPPASAEASEEPPQGIDPTPRHDSGPENAPAMREPPPPQESGPATRPEPAHPRHEDSGPAPRDASSADAERRERLRQRLEELSRRLGNEAMEPPRDEAPQRDGSPEPRQEREESQGRHERALDGADHGGGAEDGAGDAIDPPNRDAMPRRVVRDGDSMPRETHDSSEQRTAPRPQEGAEGGERTERREALDGRGEGNAPRPESLDDRAVEEPAPGRVTESREAGGGAGREPGSRPESPPADGASRPRIYDLEAIRPDPDRPGSVIERERDRDPEAPVARDAGPRAPSGAVRGATRRGAAEDPSISPRFRPLIERYFERVRREADAAPGAP